MSETEMYRVIHCDYCGEPWTWKVRQGIPPKWCSRTCRQKEYNKRRGADRAEKRASEIALDNYLASLCPDDHKTWASKAKCRWADMQIEGEGQYASWHPSWGTQIRLWATFRDACAGTRGGQIVTLHRGVHIKGGKNE